MSDNSKRILIILYNQINIINFTIITIFLFNAIIDFYQISPLLSFVTTIIIFNIKIYIIIINSNSRFFIILKIKSKIKNFYNLNDKMNSHENN